MTTFAQIAEEIEQKYQEELAKLKLTTPDPSPGDLKELRKRVSREVRLQRTAIK